MSQENIKRNREEERRKWIESRNRRNAAEAESTPLVLATLSVFRDEQAGRVVARIALPCDSRIELRISDENLKELFHHSSSLRQGIHELAIDPSHFPPGEYIVELRTCIGNLLRILRT